MQSAKYPVNEDCGPASFDPIETGISAPILKFQGKGTHAGYKTTNAHTREVEKEFDYATDVEVEAALDKAHEAFKVWSKNSYAERGEIMHRVADLFRERAEETAAIVTKEMGLPINTSVYLAGEMVAQMLDYYADNAEEFLKPEKVEVNPAAGTAELVYQPLGVIFAVEPWNATVYQAVRPACGNLMVGNTVVLKHAAIVPQSAEAIEKIFLDGGVPEGVFTNIRANYDQAERIIADDRVRGVTLTGSDAAGSIIAGHAGKHIKPSVLELGGNDAQIVFEDADLDNAVSCSMFRFMVTRQVCISPKRMFIHEDIYDEFVERFKERISATKIGDPMDPATGIEPLSSQDAQETIREQISRAVEYGATATELGEPIPDHGWFVQPTLLTGIELDNPIWREELFGPVPSVYKFSTEEEVIELANDSQFGLAGSVYSGDVERARRVAEAIDTGLVGINQPAAATYEMPFGGTKRSGCGKEM